MASDEDLLQHRDYKLAGLVEASVDMALRHQMRNFVAAAPGIAAPEAAECAAGTVEAVEHLVAVPGLHK